MLLALQVGLDSLWSIVDDEEAAAHLAHLHLLMEVIRRLKASDDWLQDVHATTPVLSRQGLHVCCVGGWVPTPSLSTLWVSLA